MSVHLDETAEPEQERPVRLAEAIEARLGIRYHDRLLSVGSLLLIVGADNRLRSMEWRFGPAVLRPGLVRVPPARPVALHIDVPWDGNDRATVPGPDHGVFDLATRAMAISRAPEPSVWGVVAEGFVLGLSDTGALAAVVLHGGLMADLPAMVQAAGL